MPAEKDGEPVERGWINQNLYIWTGETGWTGLKWMIALWLLGGLPFAILVGVLLYIV